MKNVAKNPKYEIRFQLLVVGLDKVYEIIRNNRDILEKEGETEKITEAKMTIIENTCLLMDFIMNFNTDDMIYKAFKKLKNKHWLGDLILSVKFLEKYVDLLDELTTKEFGFVRNIMPNIMNGETIPEYPYENSIKEFLLPADDVKSSKTEKKNRKLKKGPTLIDPVPDIKFEL